MAQSYGAIEKSQEISRDDGTLSGDPRRGAGSKMCGGCGCCATSIPSGQVGRDSSSSSTRDASRSPYDRSTTPAHTDGAGVRRGRWVMVSSVALARATTRRASRRARTDDHDRRDARAGLPSSRPDRGGRVLLRSSPRRRSACSRIAASTRRRSRKASHASSAALSPSRRARRRHSFVRVVKGVSVNPLN